MEIFALDLGNLQTKVKSSKKTKVLPSKFADYEDLGNQATALTSSTLDIQEFSTNYDPLMTYAWGSDIALAKVKTYYDTIGFEKRYSREEFRLLSSFAIGELAKDFHEAKKGILNVEIITGVPTDEFSKRNVSDIIKTLKTDHNITIDGEKLNVRVNEVKVVPQPVGSVYNEMLDIDGNINNSDFDKQTISVIDCGGGTVLIDTLNDMNLSNTDSARENTGAHSLYKKIHEYIDTTQIPLNTNDIELILRNQKNKYYYEQSSANGIVHDITEPVEKGIKKYTREIKSLINSTLKDTSHIDYLFFTGGGSNLLDKEDILNRFDKAIFLESSETANVNGFYKFGAAVSESVQNDE